MPELEPYHGYDHSLTISQIVGRMIGFDEEANEVPLEIVLDGWVEDAEYDHDKAERRDASPVQLEKLMNEVNRRRGIRGDTMEMYAELHSAADEIYQGRNHPYLVLCRPTYEKGFPEFTIRSAYYWAKARGKNVPEWAPRDEQADANASNPISSPKNLRVTLFIVTQALGSLVDKLEQDEHISTSADQPCINDQDVANLPAIARYILSADIGRSGAGQPTEAYDIDVLALALVTLTLAGLAEKARAENWITFRDKHNEVNHKSFLSNDLYVTSRMYRHLIKPKLQGSGVTGQGERSIQERLNNARDLIKISGLPQFSQEQLLERLEAAQVAYNECIA